MPASREVSVSFSNAIFSVINRVKISEHHSLSSAFRTRQGRSSVISKRIRTTDLEIGAHLFGLAQLSHLVQITNAQRINTRFGYRDQIDVDGVMRLIFVFPRFFHRFICPVGSRG